MQAGQRQLAAQGYTGSGNALVEAAEASGQVYQQEFNNLAMLSGANANPGAGFGNAMQGLAGAQANALNSRQAGNDQRLSGTTGVVNNLADLASSFNRRPATPVPQRAVAPVRRARIPVPRTRPTAPRISIPRTPRG